MFKMGKSSRRMTTGISMVSSAFLYERRLLLGFAGLELLNPSLHLDQHGHEHHVNLVRDGDHCSRIKL